MHADVCLDEAFAAMTYFYLESLWFDFIWQNFFFSLSSKKENNSAPLLVLQILIWLNLIWKTSPASFAGTAFEVTIWNNKPY